MTDPLERLRTALAGRYTLERELGAGGMAVVYLARDVKHDRLVSGNLGGIPEDVASSDTTFWRSSVSLSPARAHGSTRPRRRGTPAPGPRGPRTC